MMMKPHEVINALSAAADWILAFLIIIKCSILLMPFTGVRIARRVLQERHALRARITELIGEHQSEVWVRHIVRQEANAYAKIRNTLPEQRARLRSQ
jgi:hypothetical protein